MHCEHTAINQYGIKLIFPSFTGEVQSRTSSREINKLCTIKQKIIRMPTTTINLHDLTLRHTHPISSRRRQRGCAVQQNLYKEAFIIAVYAPLALLFLLVLHQLTHRPALPPLHPPPPPARYFRVPSHRITSHWPQSQVLSLALRLIITSI